MQETILKNESGIECRVIFNKNNKVALVITEIKMLHQIKYLGNEHKNMEDK